MTIMEFIGCACMAYGPALALFIFTIMEDPIRIIILIASAFFWLLSLLLSSIVWICLPFENALFLGVIVSVILQEVFRYLICFVLQKAEAGLKKLSIPNTSMEIANNKNLLSFVAGLGFGLISGAFSIVNVLAEVIGPGTMGLEGGSPYFCLISSSFTLCFILLHTFWSVLFFYGVENKSYIHICWVVGSHLLVSCLTLLNQRSLYIATILPAYIVLIVTAFLAYRVCSGNVHTGFCRGRHPTIVSNGD